LRGQRDKRAIGKAEAFSNARTPRCKHSIPDLVMLGFRLEILVHVSSDFRYYIGSLLEYTADRL
jgi:hypothetical protein